MAIFCFVTIYLHSTRAQWGNNAWILKVFNFTDPLLELVSISMLFFLQVLNISLAFLLQYFYTRFLTPYLKRGPVGLLTQRKKLQG